MVQIFQFYTGENPSNYVFKAVGKVRSITWDQDDLGIFIGTQEGTVTYFRLQESYFVRQQIFNLPGYNIGSVSISKDKLLFGEEKSVFIAGAITGIPEEEKCIYEVKMSLKSEKDEKKELGEKVGEKKERKLFNTSAPN